MDSGEFQAWINENLSLKSYHLSPFLLARSMAWKISTLWGGRGGATARDKLWQKQEAGCKQWRLQRGWCSAVSLIRRGQRFLVKRRAKNVTRKAFLCCWHSLTFVSLALLPRGSTGSEGISLAALNVTNKKAHPITFQIVSKRSCNMFFRELWWMDERWICERNHFIWWVRSVWKETQNKCTNLGIIMTIWNFDTWEVQ